MGAFDGMGRWVLVSFKYCRKCGLRYARGGVPKCTCAPPSYSEQKMYPVLGPEGERLVTESEWYRLAGVARQI